MVHRDRRILIVDDEVNVCRALRRTLSREGYRIETFTNPLEALERLRQASFDVVVSDQLMPGLTGLELLKRVRDRHSDVARILLTGHADMQTAIAAINEGELYRFLTKPWDDLELKVFITLALEKVDHERENRALLARMRALTDWELEGRLRRSSIRRDADGAIILDA